ncbi:hypothetical protein AHAS_Ahas19G0371900 [Arachis hypogaea]
MDSVLILFDWMKKRKIETNGSFGPNLYIYNAMLGLVKQSEQFDEMENILNEMARDGIAYKCPILKPYWHIGEDGYGALNFFVDFREKYRQGGIGRDDDGEDWESELIKLEKFTIRVCYQIMRCWLVSHDNSSNHVLKLLIDMDNAGIPLGRADLERLAWACTREDHCIVIKEVYTRIRKGMIRSSCLGAIM